VYKLGEAKYWRIDMAAKKLGKYDVHNNYKAKTAAAIMEKLYGQEPRFVRQVIAATLNIDSANAWHYYMSLAEHGQAPGDTNRYRRISVKVPPANVSLVNKILDLIG